MKSLYPTLLELFKKFQNDYIENFQNNKNDKICD